jgi:hypothetical protein
MGAFNAATPLPLAAVMTGCAVIGLALHLFLRPRDLLVKATTAAQT